MRYLFFLLLLVTTACSSDQGGTKDSTDKKIADLKINPEEAGMLHNIGMECVLQSIYQASEARLDTAAILEVMYDCVNELFQDMGADSLPMEQFNQLLAIALAMNNQLEQSPMVQEDFPLFLDSAEVADYSAKDRGYYYEMKADINGLETIDETLAATNHYLIKLKNGEGDISAEARNDFIFMLQFIKDDMEYHTNLLSNRKTLMDSLKKKLSR